MDQRSDVPWYLDWSRHLVNLGLGVGMSAPVAWVTLGLYGADALMLAAALGAVSVGVGTAYAVDALVRQEGW